jgi:polyribonucleotide nucleotidyltransferase
VGTIYKGKVASTVDFGAFVTFIGKTDGLVHISELADKRVEKTTDVVNQGDEVYVKCIGMERGTFKLSMKVVNQETGEDISDQFPEAEKKERRPRKEA